MDHPWLLDWPRAAAAGAAVCGGKGWNLGRLDRYGFDVPAGGVLVAEAYRRSLAAPGLQAAAAALADATAERVTEPAVARRLEEFRAAVESAELPAEAADAVRAFLAETGLADRPVAVRSSATAEDGAAASFAGMHHSFLNVRGVEAVLRAVKGCYASLWTPQAVAYRRRLGLADADVACAVVLCAMVPGPQSAGVAFSCDPRTGRRDLIVLNAVRGLGDELVSGRVNPEGTVVRLARGRLQLERRADGAARRVLGDDEALRLAWQVLRVHWALGDGQDPQDVEWAYDGERFWLVQARPVTRLPRVTFPEVAGLPTVWSNGNLKEVAGGVLTPMTWGLLQQALWDILFAAHEAVGYKLPPGTEVVRRFAGRAYFDLTTMQWAFYDCFGMTPAELNTGLGGHQPEIPVPRPSWFGRRPWGRLWRGVRLLGVLWQAERRLPGEIDRLHRLAREEMAHDLTGLTREQLRARWDWLYEGWGFGRLFQLGNASAGFRLGVLQKALARLSPERGPALALALLAGSDGVTSAEHGYRLADLADAARRDPAARAYLEQGHADPHGWRRLPDGSPFRTAFEAFLAEFGHRGLDETEMARPRWNEDPSYLLEQVRFLLTADRPPSREAARAARATAEAEVGRLPAPVRPLVRRLAAGARAGAARREAGKSAMVAAWEPMRAVVQEVGRRLAAAGRLNDPADVFQLSYAGLEMYLAGAWDGRGAAALAADLKARAAAWAKEAPPDVIVDEAGARPGLLHVPPAPAAGAGVFTGLAVSAGRAAGPACVLRHPADGGRLRRGDVLVAPSTDPGWTPLFLRASALVMEVGGYLSHGAIVAREYGLPAVVNVPGVVNAVRDGERLTVDGDAGRVVRGAP